MKKKMMKKAAAALTGLTLAINLMACGSQDSGNNTQQARQESEDAAAESAQDSSAQMEEKQTAQEPENSDQPDAEGGKTLVVYYSATGNTEGVAGYIAAATGADIFELEPAEPYSSDDLKWTDENSRVVYEHDNPEARNVELVATTVDDWESYDTIFIGYAGGIIGLNQEKPQNRGFALI